MKRLFAVLFFTFVLAGPAFADELSYEIDPVATAKAPWKVGEKIIKEGHCSDVDYYLKFLGVTQSGSALVQDFYLSGEKFSDPFLMTVTNARENTGKACWENVEGQYIQWHKNGQKYIEGNFKNGQAEGLMTLWDESGRKLDETYYQNGEIVGLIPAEKSGGVKLVNF